MIDILLLIIGAVLGAVLSVALQAIYQIKVDNRSIPKNGDLLKGEWYHHYSNIRNGSPEFNREKWKIIQTRGNLKVYVEDTPFSYVGKVTFEEKFALVHLNGKTHEEEIFYRIPFVKSEKIRKSNNASIDKLVGLASSQDFDDKASVLPVVIAKKQLEEHDCIDLINKSVSLDVEKKIITL